MSCETPSDVQASVIDEKLTVKQTYHESGNMATETFFNAQGKRHGLYKEWYPSGELQVEKRYDNGEVKYDKLVGKDGKIFQNIVYRDGREYGLLFSSYCLNGVTKGGDTDSLILNPKN